MAACRGDPLLAPSLYGTKGGPGSWLQADWAWHGLSGTGMLCPGRVACLVACHAVVAWAIAGVENWFALLGQGAVEA